MKKKLRIGINAQIPAKSGAGGIETVLRALTALGRLEDGDEEYIFITHWSDPDWLKPLLTERQKIVAAPNPELTKESNRANSFEFLKQHLRPLVRRAKSFIAAAPTTKIGIPISDGFYESLDCDVIHFPYQDYVRCPVPTVYNPHDLQHLHYPEFFTAQEFQRRELIYPQACRAAQTIVAASQYVKRDIAEKYQIAAEKIQVIPWSPADAESSDFTQTEANSLLEKYDCPASFMLYPAMTWEHKNHLRLIEAVYLLRERENLKINLVCTGHKNDFYPQIEKLVRELNLEKQIRFTGITEYKELSVFYRLARFVIIPTLFEAMSAPLFEAWQYGAPVACASVTSLPEQAANAALLFDPFSVEDIAAAIKKMAADENLRAELRTRGFRRLKNFDQQRTAKAYRAVYRKAAGIKLNEEDEYLLGCNWTQDS